MTLASRHVLLAITVTLLSAGGCSCNAFEGLGGLGEGVVCAFDFDFDETPSDHRRLQAKVDCEPGVDCADVRTVAVGASFGLAISTGPESERSLAASELRVESSDPEVLELEGFTLPDQTCDGYELSGHARFVRTGTAALIVYQGEEEIDRFTATASEVVSADLQETYAFFGGGGWTPVGDRIVVDGMHLHSVRVIARSAGGARLIGAKPARITVDDPELVELRGGGSSLLFPQQLGTTTLRAMVAGAEVSVPIDIEGLLPSDGGTLDELSDDAGVDEE